MGVLRVLRPKKRGEERNELGDCQTVALRLPAGPSL